MAELMQQGQVAKRTLAALVGHIDRVAVVRARVVGARVVEVHLLHVALDALEALRPALVDDVIGLLSDQRPFPIVWVVGGEDRQIQRMVDCRGIAGAQTS